MGWSGRGNAPAPTRGTPGETFRVALRLGLTSFGGPIAHVGYFRREYVDRRRWLDEQSFGDLVALVPVAAGPGQQSARHRDRDAARGRCRRRRRLARVHAAVGDRHDALRLPRDARRRRRRRLGPRPQARGGRRRRAGRVRDGADARRPDWPGGSWRSRRRRSRWRGPCPSRRSRSSAAGALAGLLVLAPPAERATGPEPSPVAGGSGRAAFALFVVLLVGLPSPGGGRRLPAVALFAAFYRSGSLVFGGGHLVLPLLDATVVAPGWVTQSQFLAGYGAAQALPGAAVHVLGLSRGGLVASRRTAGSAPRSRWSRSSCRRSC